MNEPVAVAVLAKAPLAGFAKTRLIPVLGADGAAMLQARLTERAVATACAAAIGPVTLWATPDDASPGLSSHPRALRHCAGAPGRRRSRCTHAGGNRGSERTGAGHRHRLPCPHIRPLCARRRTFCAAAPTPSSCPAEDGGYALIGMRAPEPALFSDMRWSTPDVMARPAAGCASAASPGKSRSTLWDVDVPEDLERLREIGLRGLIEGE